MLAFFICSRNLFNAKHCIVLVPFLGKPGPTSETSQSRLPVRNGMKAGSDRIFKNKSLVS